MQSTNNGPTKAGTKHMQRSRALVICTGSPTPSQSALTVDECIKQQLDMNSRPAGVRSIPRGVRTDLKCARSCSFPSCSTAW